MGAVAGMMGLTATLGGAIDPGIYNFTSYGTKGSPDGGFSSPFVDVSSFNSNSDYIQQVGTLAAATSGMNRYIVFMTASQSTSGSADTSLLPTARLAGTTMTLLAEQTQSSSFNQSVSAHYIVYNSAGTPTLDWRKRDGGTQDLFTLRTTAYSFEVPDTLSLTTDEISSFNLSNDFTIDQSGAVRAYFSALHKGNQSTNQTITKSGGGGATTSIVDAQGDIGTDELYAFGSLEEDNIGVSTTITANHVTTSSSTRRALLIGEMLFS